MQRYDLAVIGSGMGGFAAATHAAKLGAKTLLVERRLLGGTCVNEGCIPTKALLWAAELINYARNAEKYGFRVESVEVDFPALMATQQRIVAELRTSFEAAIDESPLLDYMHGQTSFSGPTELVVDGATLNADKIILAVGSQALVPPIDGLRQTGFLTNREVLSLKALPHSMIIVGGGPVAVEFAQMFARFGTKVILLQRGPRILPSSEPLASQLVAEALEEEGVEIYVGANVVKAMQLNEDRGVVARLGNTEQVFEAEQILVATGRAPDLAPLNLDAAHIQVLEGKVVADRELRTTADNVWLLGDVTGGPQFAHYATDTARIAVENALLGRHEQVPEGSLPGAVFTSPEVASVGLTEDEATAAGYHVRTVVHPLAGAPKARITQERRGFIKIISEASTDKILGLHIVGYRAGEMLHEGLAVMQSGGTVRSIQQITHVHPTMNEALKAAADKLLGAPVVPVGG